MTCASSHVAGCVSGWPRTAVWWTAIKVPGGATSGGRLLRSTAVATISLEATKARGHRVALP
eukprot:scaffold84174_cov45-Phaeocystis_antarctica.AAC.1